MKVTCRTKTKKEKVDPNIAFNTNKKRKKGYRHVKYHDLIKYFKDRLFVDQAINDCIKSAKKNNKRGNNTDRINYWLINREYIIKEVAKIPENLNWRPKPFHTFTLKEYGKNREIEAIRDCIDNVVYRLISNIIKPIFNAKLYRNSCCNVKGKGPQHILRKLAHYINEENRRYWGYKSKKYCSRSHNYFRSTNYFMKFDVRKYYPSIDLDILEQKVRKYIKDDRFVRIMFLFLRQYKNGLGLGGAVNSILANFYLKDIDDYILKTIRRKAGDFPAFIRGGYYFRYMDDIVILHSNKRFLNKFYKEIKKELRLLKLSVKHTKTTKSFAKDYDPLKTKDENVKTKLNFIDFVGYRFYPNTKIKIRSRTRLKIIQMLRGFKKRFALGLVTLKEARSFLSLYGFLKNSKSTYLIERYLGKDFKLLHKLKKIICLYESNNKHL